MNIRNNRAVTPRHFRTIKCGIGPFFQHARILIAATRDEAVATCAERHHFRPGQRLVVRQLNGAHGGDGKLGNGECRFTVGIRQNNRELLSAVAGNKIGLTQV